jgi:hypothetical protein
LYIQTRPRRNSKTPDIIVLVTKNNRMSALNLNTDLAEIQLE